MDSKVPFYHTIQCVYMHLTSFASPESPRKIERYHEVLPVAETHATLRTFAHL